MSTPVSSSARRRFPTTYLPRQRPTHDVMLRTIQEFEPKKHAAILDLTALAYEEILAKRRKTFETP